jgi:hypothetical protein
MRYRIFAKQETEEQLFHSEEELIEALTSHGWELQRRAAEELVASRARRFSMAKKRNGTSSSRRAALPS